MMRTGESSLKEFIKRVPSVHSLLRGRLARTVRRWADQQLAAPTRAFRYRNKLRIMITGTKGKTTTTIMVARIMEEAGHRVGYCTTDGVVINSKTVATGDLAWVLGARRVLTDPFVNCAILETARGGLLKAGLFVSTCNAAVLLNIGWDHIGQEGVESREAMLKVKKRVTDASRGRVVLNGEDALVAPLAHEYGIHKTTLFAMNDNAVAEHVSSGGEAVTVSGGSEPRIVHRGPNGETDIMAVADIPASLGGQVPFIVSNALAATALARAVGVPPETIAKALSKIDLSGDHVPGRFRRISGFPFDIFIDRGHEPAGLAGFFSGIKVVRSGGGGAMRAMLMGVGNRPDWYFDEMARIALDAGVESFVLYDNASLRRNRVPGEVPKRMAAWLNANGVVESRISQFLDVDLAVKKMVSEAQSGETLCFLGEKVGLDLAGLVLTELEKAGISRADAH